MAVRPRRTAAVHPIERLMAEHDGVGPADPHPSRTERPRANFTAGHHDLARSDRSGLERRPDTLRVGWTAPRSPRTCLPAPPSSWWLRCLYHPPHPSAPGCPHLWPDPVTSGPLVSPEIVVVEHNFHAAAV